MRTLMVGPFLAWLRTEGHSLRPLLEIAGLEEADVGSEATEIDYERFVAFLDGAEKLTRDPTIGLSFARGAKTVFRLLEPLSQHCPDVRTGFRALVNAPTVDRLVHRLEEFGDFAEYTITSSRYDLSRERVGNEFLIAWALLQVRLGVGKAVSAEAVRFMHSAPTSPGAIGAYHTLFGTTRIRFDQPDNALVLSRETLDLRSLVPDPHMFEALRARLTTIARPASDRDAFSGERVRELIRKEMSRGRPTLATVAKTLGTATRTLQRRLQEANTTFDAEVDACREAVAYDLLAAGHPMTFIAAELGFRNEGAFFRAFRRWSNMTPGTYRKTRLSSIPPAMNAAS